MNHRVRFSPAPTGYLHVGSARSALFNWMYARHVGGTMILRVEDTDADRSKPELIGAIYESLEWLDIDWDEEYLQSDRFDDYTRAAQSFIDNGTAYRCDCTQEETQARAEARGEKGGGYDGFCREREVAADTKSVVRFRTPDDGVTGWDDVVRGRVEFDNAHIDDFVIVRSSGVPMFHVANAYDDLDMGITHVVRGEDLVNATPKVIMLMKALGAEEPPVYAHLPLIVNEKRQKLSKRRDDVAVGLYRERGILPEAMRNYLLTLGWGPKDEVEIKPIEEFVAAFELEDINKAPAFFDVVKLEAFNAHYIRELSEEEFVEMGQPFLDGIDPDLFAKMAGFVQERVKRLDEIPSLLSWIHGDAPEPTPKAWKKAMRKPETADALTAMADRLGDCEWTSEVLEEIVFGVGTELGIRTQLPARVAITGSNSGIPLFEPMAEMPRAVVIERLLAAKAKLEAGVEEK